MQIVFAYAIKISDTQGRDTNKNMMHKLQSHLCVSPWSC